MNTRLRELSSAARQRQNAKTRNLVFTFQYKTFCRVSAALESRPIFRFIRFSATEFFPYRTHLHSLAHPPLPSFFRPVPSCPSQMTLAHSHFV